MNHSAFFPLTYDVKSLSRGSDKQFSHKTVLTTTHEQNIIYIKKLNDILIQVNIRTFKETIICQQLFGGLSGDEKEKNHQMIPTK